MTATQSSSDCIKYKEAVLIRGLASALDWVDRRWSRAVAERSLSVPHLLIPLCHAVTHDPAAAARLLAPQLAVTLDELRRLLDAVLSAGYSPISARDLTEQRQWADKHVILTFDDGYFNNAWALRVLEEFAVPATFFISTSHVRESRAFWWDVAARAWRSQGVPDRGINARLERLKCLPPARIEAELSRQLGANAMRPVSDLDRPFTPAELREFARSPWVTLGNHTAEHTILTHCTARGAELTIQEGQQQLEEITGVRPTAIAYPDGAFSRAIARAASTTGHRLGFTCEPKSNTLPLEGDATMLLGRHMVRPGQDYKAAVRTFACRTVLPGARLKAAIRSVARGAGSPVFPRPLARCRPTDPL